MNITFRVSALLASDRSRWLPGARPLPSFLLPDTLPEPSRVAIKTFRREASWFRAGLMGAFAPSWPAGQTLR